MKVFKKAARGQIVLMTALSLVVIFAVAGLVIDAGVGYLMKAKLNAAVDAAAIAAGRAVTEGVTQADQEASARAAARRFFAADYPNGWLGTVPTMNEPAITFDRGKVTIDVSAHVDKPVSFMRVLGLETTLVSAASQVVRKDLDLAFVVDVTGSMAPVASAVKTNAALFLQHFSPTTDRMSLIHFAFGAEVDVPFRATQRGFDRPGMTAKINTFNFNGNTNYSEALWQARDQLNNVIATASRSSLRVIVFFSDGSPNTFASLFGFKKTKDCATPGALATPDTSSHLNDCSDCDGLYVRDKQNQQLDIDKCYQNNIGSHLDANNALPDYFTNLNGQVEPDFPVVGGLVTRAPTYRNINQASRNLAQAMALKSRQEGIYIFTLGLGPLLTEANGAYGERGDVLLKTMANTPDSAAHDPGQPTGVYCYAATADDLAPCFSRLASEIMRITR